MFTEAVFTKPTHRNNFKCLLTDGYRRGKPRGWQGEERGENEMLLSHDKEGSPLATKWMH